MEKWIAVSREVLFQLESGEFNFDKEIVLQPYMHYSYNAQGQQVVTTYPVRDFIRHLEGNKSVTKLGINNFNINLEDARELARILPTTNILSVRIEGNQEASIEAGAMELIASVLSDSEVSSLRVDNCDIGQQGAEELARYLANTKLKDLTLSDNDIGDKGVRVIMDNLPSSLDCLEIKNENIGALGLEGLRNVLSKSAIKELNLANTQIGTEGARVIAEFLPNSLRSLELEENDLRDEGVGILSAALSKSNVSYLGLGLNRISEKGAASLTQALTNMSIAGLNLSSNNLGSLGGKIILEALEGKEIEFLGLGKNNIGDSQFSMFANALAYKSIKQLGLDLNGIGDSNISDLVIVLPTMLIESLSLHANDIGEDGAIILARALPDTHINKLSLEECSIPSKGLKAIAEIICLGKIIDLNISRNDIDDSFLEVLADALGNTNTRVSNLDLGHILLTKEMGDKIANSIKNNFSIANIQVGFNMIYESHRAIIEICGRNESLNAPMIKCIEAYQKYETVKVEIGSEAHRDLTKVVVGFSKLASKYSEEEIVGALHAIKPDVCIDSFKHFYGRILSSITGVIKHMALYSNNVDPASFSSKVEDSSEELTPAKLACSDPDILASVFSYLTVADISSEVVQTGDVNPIGEES